jgi:hypothetical protein
MSDKDLQTQVIDRIIMLMEEIKYAESQLQPHDTGHIHTAIGWMKQRVQELKINTDGISQ